MRAAADNNAIFVVDDSGQVSSLDAETGKLNWTSSLGKTVSTGITVGESILAFATRDGEVVAVSALNGATVWTANVLGSVLSVPSIGNGKVYVQTEDGRVIALSQRDGTVAWTVERTVPTLSLHGDSGSIFIQGLLAVGLANGHVVGIDSRNGRAGNYPTHWISIPTSSSRPWMGRNIRFQKI